ncbi:hypothetical protein ACFL2S_06535 [Thermodesulfobacteriota bacterium]
MKRQLHLMRSALIFITIALMFVFLIFALFPFGAHIDGDTGDYFAMTVQAVENGIFGIRQVHYPMGYPLLLGLARYVFIDDFLKGALFINAVSFFLVFFILVRESTETGNGRLPWIERIYSVILLFWILFTQYFNSRILFSAWAEAPFIAFSVVGLYFLGRSRKNRPYPNFAAFCALTFFVAAWYCKYVGVVGILVFFIVILLMFQAQRSIWIAMLKGTALLGLLSVLVAPAAVLNYLRTGNVLGPMASSHNAASIHIKFSILDNYLDRVFEFFGNIFTHLLSSIYLARYPDLLIGILVFMSALAVFWVFGADFLSSDKDSNGLIARFLIIRHIEWYIWVAAYTAAMIIKLLAHDFSTQAMSRYASLLIPIVCLLTIDWIRMLKPVKQRIIFPMLITIFSVLCIISIFVNLPNYSQVPKKIYINNYHNLRGYPQFKQIQEMLNEVEAVYFLPRRNNWPIADKFYAFFPCKEFYVSRDWAKGMYDEKIYTIPKFNASYAVVSDYEADEVLRFITGKGVIIKGTTILGFSIYLVKPYDTLLKAPIAGAEERNRYLGQGFISHGCR